MSWASGCSAAWSCWATCVFSASPCGASGFRHHHLAAEFLRLRQVRSDILHFDVEDGVVMGLVPERGDVPLDAALRSRLNHEGRAHLCPNPAKEGSIELAGLRRVRAADPEMHNWF
jgi:hypothetical protein